MSIETRSNSALLKRAEQLKRWQESDTCRRSGEHRLTYKPKVQFTDGCVFLAACAASDKEEVRRLLARGADIDTANVDGLTALHQACIDDNLEMVEFLVERGADVNRGDNEGWTPLHATASCGFLSIAKYLLEHNCNVAAVNNDGELAIDISESDEMEELLQNEISTRSIDCDASRVVEERMMFEDATKWVESDKFGDVPHQKTGATSLHVAAAKGYIKVIGLLLECHAPINIQDYDGWTPLHAAAHWAQREAIDLLCKNLADMDIKNYVGQTCFDVADPDVLKLLEDLKRKQASMQKERPDFRNLVNRPSITSSLANSGGRRSINLVTTNNNNNIVNSNNRNIKIIADDDNSDRSSITRLSIDDKELRSKKDSSYERDSLRGSSLVSETIQESNKSNAESDSDVGRKNRANLSDNNSLPKITLSKDDSSNKVPGYSPPHPAESDKKKPIASSPSESSDDVHPWRRPVSLRSRPVSSTLNSKKDDSSDSDVPLRRIHSFESDEKFYTRLTELREKIRANHTSTSSNPSTTSNEQTPYRSTNSSYRYLNTTPSSSSSSTNFSSLPRTLGHRNLPSLPECSKNSPTNGSSGSLIRSSSLRDNSVAYTPVPLRQSAEESPSTSQLNTLNNNNNIDNNILNDNNNNNHNNSNHNNNNSNNNTRLLRRHPQSTDDDSVHSSSSISSSKSHKIETSALISDDKKSNDFASPHSRPTTLLVGRSLWKRHEPEGGNRVKSDSSLANNSLSTKHQPPQTHVRSAVDENVNSSLPSKEDDHQSMNDKSTLGSVFKNFFKSFVPPVRDEESETQRKAHAKRVRETRRSTQGVTLEDLKSAEQLVKKKQQQENQIRTSELQQLAAAASGGVGSTATTTVTTSATLLTSGGSSPASTPSSTSSVYDRKPSWRLKSEGAIDRNKFRLEDAGPSETLNALRKSSKIEGKGPPPLPSSDPPPLSSPGSKDGSLIGSSITTPTGTQQVIQRRKKPKRRSTGVVHLDIGDLNKLDDEEGSETEEEEEEEEAAHNPSLTLASLEREVNGLKVAAEEDEKLIVLRKDDLNSLLTAKPTLLIGKELNLSGDNKTSSSGGASGNNPSSSSNKFLHPSNAHQPTSGYHTKSMEKDSHNGGNIDYKKLWEESQLENSRLKDELSKSEDTRGRLEGALHSASKPQMSEAEKREKRALEKKLSEMEEELKLLALSENLTDQQIEHLKNEIQRLRDENGALIRVISKLSK